MDMVIGSGQIQGCDPITYLKKQNKEFIVVDNDPKCPAIKQHNLKASNTHDLKGQVLVQGDITTALNLLETVHPEHIFPVRPIHIVAELAKTKFKLQRWDEAINPILPYLPPAVIFRAGRGELVLTFNRDKDCIQKCKSPQTAPTSKQRTQCTMTRPRPCTMDQLMRYACPEGFILFSHTMSPGLGAFKGSEIIEFFNWAEKKNEFVVGTSCNCHGVFWGFRKTPNTR
jgi:hypothetical protein